MPKWVDGAGDGKLDWFSNEYVYGTEVPHHDISTDFSTDQNGVTSVHVKISQSRVSDHFLMLVPVYMQMANGNTTASRP